MCGICGFVSVQKEVRSAVERMNDCQMHRGPDAHGSFFAPSIGLGHVRLKIIDLTNAASQPMKYKTLVLVFNGEIYNFKQLRTQLEAKGYNFTSRSDTEVLLKAWDYWGAECLPMLEGMFAFAIYDTVTHHLHLCRDPYGVKPLFYCSMPGEFIFASELTALRQGIGRPFKMDPDAVASYLALHFIPAPQTGCLGVQKLAPGQRLLVTGCDSYPKIMELVSWAQPFKPRRSSQPVSMADLDFAIRHSVEKQMVSDVPVGAFLSGGVDSSLVCYYAGKISKAPLHTFSIGFSDAGPEYDESGYAKTAARILGARHHAVTVELAGVSEYIDKILLATGELNADTSVFLNYIVSEAARKHVTVCLSGAGGDELFGGYYRHQALLVLKYLNCIPGALVRLISSLLNRLPQNRDIPMGNLVRRLAHLLEQHGGSGGYVNLLRHDKIFAQDSAFFSRQTIRTLEDAMAFDFRYYLGDNILSFSDKMSMLHSLEVRVPFLSPQVVRIAEAMQTAQRVQLREKKTALKQLGTKYFPRSLMYRKKQGFAAPIEVWLRQMSKDQLQRRCNDGVVNQFIAPRVVGQLIGRFLDERKDYSLQLYSFIVLNQWYDNLCT